MKKLLGLALIALLILPLTVKATITLSGSGSQADENGIITGNIYVTVETAEEIIGNTTIKLEGNHVLIKSIEGIGAWVKDEENSFIAEDGKTATYVFKYSDNNGVYEGTGEKVQIGIVKYQHDPEYAGTEPCNLVMRYNEAPVTIEEKQTPNAKTGSVLPYVGIIAGVSLIAAAYVISKKTNKLYKI